MDPAQKEATTTVKHGPLEETAKALEATATTTINDTSDPSPRLLALQARHASLTHNLSSLRAERAALISSTPLPSGLTMPATWSEEEKDKHALDSANAVIKEHIRLLHAYNEVKDVGQGLMGLVAEGRGVRMREVMGDFGVGEKD